MPDSGAENSARLLIPFSQDFLSCFLESVLGTPGLLLTGKHTLFERASDWEKENDNE
jgi:hypothetical protein